MHRYHRLRTNYNEQLLRYRYSYSFWSLRLFINWFMYKHIREVWKMHDQAYRKSIKSTIQGKIACEHRNCCYVVSNLQPPKYQRKCSSCPPWTSRRMSHSEQWLSVLLEISRCRTDRLKSIQCLFLQVLDVTDFCSTNSRLQTYTEIKLFRDLSQGKEQAVLLVHFELSIASETGCSRNAKQI